MRSTPVTIRRKAGGFTLVELLLVLFILGTLALVTAAMVDGADEQLRFDQTKTRLEQIRRAVIGDVSRRINGESEISGFVADMGRLPVSIKELVELGDQTAWNGSTHIISDSSASGVSLEIQLHGGWRGPYLETLPESISGRRAFRDGWGNADISGAEDDFGWIFEVPGEALFVQSLGLDGEPGAIDPDNDYQHDYPPTGRNLIEKNDYTLTLDHLKVEFSQAPTGISQNLYVRLFHMMDGDLSDVSVPESDFFPTVSGVRTYHADFAGEALPFGQYAAVVLCYPLESRVFDGQCGDGNSLNTHPFYFNLAPRRQLPTIQWNTHQ